MSSIKTKNTDQKNLSENEILVPNEVLPKKIHPIVIYPYGQPEDYKDLESLYKFIAKLDADKQKYARPLTVMNRQTYYNNAKYKFDKDGKWNKKFKEFCENTVKNFSTVVDAWSVDTCQMWLAGFGQAYDNEGTGEDVYWLIPGDFNYSTSEGEIALKALLDIPEAVMNKEQDLCLGEINVQPNNSKQLIDTYGTYGLLYNWFPQEAQLIREITDKPRSEFFAIRHSFLREILRQRWYAYEQMIVILLHGVIGKKRICRIQLEGISDLPQRRDTLGAAMSQVERTERVLKLFWREQNEQQADWTDRFRVLDHQSEQIRSAALVILQNLLR
jgi:hypothetical protein